jgi:hypothetical protein
MTQKKEPRTHRSTRPNHDWVASSGDSAEVGINASQPANTLTARRVKDPPVGSGAATFVNFASPPQDPWTASAMTDGGWKYGSWQAILKTAPEKSGQDLIHSACDPANLVPIGRLQDDFTKIVFHGGSP